MLTHDPVLVARLEMHLEQAWCILQRVCELDVILSMGHIIL